MNSNLYNYSSMHLHDIPESQPMKRQQYDTTEINGRKIMQYLKTSEGRLKLSQKIQRRQETDRLQREHASAMRLQRMRHRDAFQFASQRDIQEASNSLERWGSKMSKRSLENSARGSNERNSSTMSLLKKNLGIANHNSKIIGIVGKHQKMSHRDRQVFVDSKGSQNIRI